MVNRPLLLILLSFVFLINSCSYMTKKKTWPEAQEEMEAFVDRFVNDCVGRDIVAEPSPELGTKFYSKFHPGIGKESFRGQCTVGKSKPGYYASYDKSYFIYQRWQEFLNIVKSRFGIIYHDSARFISGCLKGQLHDFLLRDGETHIVVQFVNDYGKMEGCYQTYWQGATLQLNKNGLSSPDIIRPKKDKSYLVRRIDVINKDRLTELEKRELRMRYEQLSEKEKEERTKRIAHKIRLSKNNLSFWEQERQDMINLRRKTRQRERAREKAFLNQLDQQLAKGMMGLQQKVVEKQQRDHQRSMQNQASQVNFPATSQSYSQKMSASQIFKDIKGFNSDQMDENISYEEEAQDHEEQEATTGDFSRNSSQQTTEDKIEKKKSKVYEPSPEVLERETDSWFSDKKLAIAYARLKATNDIKTVCQQKEARSDTLTFSQIEAGNAPPRWNFSVPNCRQGGWKDEEWKCQAKVSGTCFRYQ